MHISELHKYLAERIEVSNYIVSLEKEYAKEILNALATEPVPEKIHSQLTPVESVLYVTLVEANGDVVLYQRLMFVAQLSSIGVVHVYINRLRKKIKQLGWGSIQTVHGRGYFLRKELNHVNCNCLPCFVEQSRR